jgi:YD repeat-containing protein
MGTVTVTPDSGVTVQSLSTNGLVAAFDVIHGGGTTSGTWTFACSATGGITCVSRLPTSATLAGDTDVTVNVTYNVGASGGILILTATGPNTDAGSINVRIPGVPTAVAWRNVNRDNRDRGYCLTAGAGEAAAWECGDLIITHGLPSYSTMGRDRSLSLLYNSAQAVPTIAVAASVSEGGSGFVAQPDSVLAILSVNTGAGFVVKDSAKYGGWLGGSGPTRQLVLRYNAATDSSGVYPVRLEVRNRYGAASYSSTINDTVLVVNRKVTPYGAGWSVEGVERLQFSQPMSAPTTADILWIGGDGSAKWYRKQSSTLWLAPKGAYQDSLVYAAGPATYTRTLRHGIQVVFDATGHHIKTISRQQQVTVFTWNTTGVRVDSIRVPPNGGARTVYKFTYASSKLDKITDPVGRILDATVNGSGQLTSLIDPDTTVATTFGYDASNRLTSRTNRRGYVTAYTYANGLRVTKAITPGAAALSDTVVYQPWDEKGLALAIGAQTAVDTATAYTKILGPRVNVADDATFWIDKWGGPLRIQNALAQVTVLKRDATGANPALVVRDSSFDGSVTSLTYNARGNLTRDTTKFVGSALPPRVTVWRYNDTNAPDSPDLITDPRGILTGFVYNTIGLTSLVVANNNHTTAFEYVLSTDSLHGLLSAVVDSGVLTWKDSIKVNANLRTQFSFDALGSVIKTVAPSGRIDSMGRDTLERVVKAYDGAGHLTEYVYDPANRIRTVRVYVDSAGIRNPSAYPADSGATAPLDTKYYYRVGVLDSVSDPRQVAHGYRLDPAGRVNLEIGEANDTTLTWYNPAGQTDSMRLRTGAKVRNRYNAGGLVVSTRWPSDSAPSALDSVYYAYDAANRIIDAQQLQRAVRTRIQRSWYPTGQLQTELDSIGITTMQQTAVYDSAGYRTLLVVSRDGTAATTDSMAYRYTDAMGNLTAIRVHWRNSAGDAAAIDSVLIAYDTLGRRDQVLFPHISDTVTFAYDSSGIQRVACSNGGGGYLNGAMYHQTVDLDGLVNLTTSIMPNKGLGRHCAYSWSDVGDSAITYDVRHQMLVQQAYGTPITDYRYDGSGNRVREWARDTGAHELRRDEVMAAKSNRLASATWTDAGSLLHTLTYFYYADGSRKLDKECFGSTCDTLHAFRYDSLARTSAMLEFPAALQTCSYDPLGRIAQSCDATTPRFGLIYDGNNVVQASKGVDNLATAGWSFVHGPGTDDPLLGYYAYPAAHVHTYYITDGQGRQFAVATAAGVRADTLPSFVNDGGKYAGGISTASTFGATRPIGASAPGISYFRNRMYDQATGRFTQEDPAGLAGGVNLYQYSGNSPPNFTDPFGLCVPFPTCAVAAGEALAGGGELVGGVVGTVVEPGGGTIVGAELGGDIGFAVGFIAASVQTIREDYVSAKEQKRDIPDNRKPHDQGKSRSKRDKHQNTRNPSKDKKRQGDDWNQNPNKRPN